MNPLSDKALELPGSGVLLYKDVTKRVSTCVLCKQPILKGDPRIVFYARLPEGREMKKGKMFRQRKFLHPDCLAKWATTSDFWETGRRVFDPMQARCFDCKFPIAVPDARAYLHKRSSNVYLCKECADSPRWRHCRICDQYVKRYSASPIVEGPVDGYYCCDYCHEETNTATVKSRKRLRREERARTNSR